jgi:hypothetical protein
MKDFKRYLLMDEYARVKSIFSEDEDGMQAYSAWQAIVALTDIATGNIKGYRRLSGVSVPLRKYKSVMNVMINRFEKSYRRLQKCG